MSIIAHCRGFTFELLLCSRSVRGWFHSNLQMGTLKWDLVTVIHNNSNQNFKMLGVPFKLKHSEQCFGHTPAHGCRVIMARHSGV